jgi:plastocyanin
MLSIRCLVFGCLAILAPSTLAACGDDDDGQPSTTAAASTPAGGGMVIDVAMRDNVFDPNEVTVSPGAGITFNLTNEGVAAHNMRIAGPDGRYRSDDDGVSDPDLSLSGETATLVWTAPAEAGEIDFRCDLHPDIMVGTISVQ